MTDTEERTSGTGASLTEEERVWLRNRAEINGGNGDKVERRYREIIDRLLQPAPPPARDAGRTPGTIEVCRRCRNDLDSEQMDRMGPIYKDGKPGNCMWSTICPLRYPDGNYPETYEQVRERALKSQPPQGDGE